jgi:hypothetical protein
MKKFSVMYSPEANIDLENLSDVIMYKYKAPLTAKKYIFGLRAEINRLSILADSLPFYSRPQLIKYGANTKRLNYKEMTIIFAVYGKIAYIYRVIPANTLTEI